MNNEIFQTIMAAPFFCFFTKNEKDKKFHMYFQPSIACRQERGCGKKKNDEKFLRICTCGFPRHILTICYEISVLKVAFNDFT